MSDNWLELLVTQTWQLSLVILIVGLLARWLQKTQPHFAALLWLIVLAKAVTPPVWSSPVGLFSWGFPSVSENAVVLEPASISPPVTGSSSDKRNNRRNDSLVTTVDVRDKAARESVSQNPYGEDWGFEDSTPATHNEVAPLLGSPLPQPVQFVEAPSQHQISSDKSWPAPFPGAAVIVTVWFCGVVVMVLFTLVRFLWLMGRLARAGRIEDAALEELVQKLRQRLRIRQKVALWVTPTNRGPAVVGCRRPCLLIPLALLQIGNSRHLEPILAHELLHIRRGDLWLGWWQTAVQCVWWFHPLVWWANRSLTRLLERCCDDEVLAELDCAPAHYARSLLSTLELKHRLHPVPTAPGVRPVDLTQERMERIMRRQHGSRSRTPWWGWGLLAIGLAITLPGAAKSLTADEPASESIPTPELEVVDVKGVGGNSENGVSGTLTVERDSFPHSSQDNREKVWRHYDVKDILKQGFGSYSSQSQQREAFLDEIVAMAIRNAELWNNDPIAQYGQPSFRQIIWEGDQLKLQATAAEHAELAQILNSRHANPAEWQLAFSVETRWTVNTDEELLKEFSWSDPDSDDALPRRTLLTTAQVEKLVQAWQRDGQTSLLFAPKITVHNGQVGSIQFVNQVPFLAERAGIEKPDTSRIGELSTWHVRPLKAGDRSVSLWLQMQRQPYSNSEPFNPQSPRVSVSRPIVRKLEIHEHLQVGQHLLLQIPEGHGKSIVGLVSVTAVKPEPLSATSPQPAPPYPPSFQTKQPFLHGEGHRIYYQLSSSNRIPPETPVRIRLSGKRSTIASEFLAKQANPPKTVAEAMTKLPEQLREEYHAKGYHFARIETTLVTEKPVVAKDWNPTNFPTAVVYINEGPRVVHAVWSDPTQQKGTLHVELHKNLTYDHLSKALFHHYWRKGCFAVEFSGRAMKETPASPETTAYQVKIDHGWPSVLGGLQIHPVPPEMMQAGLPKNFPAQMSERFDAAQIEAACQTLHQWFARHGYRETSIQVSFDEFRRSKQVQAHFFVQGLKLSQQPNGQSLKIGQVVAAAEPKAEVLFSPVRDDTRVHFRVEGAKTDIAKNFFAETSIGPDNVQKATTWLPERLLSDFQKQGYPFATVDVRIQPTCEGCLNPEYEAVITVQEGPKVIHQEWTYLSGDDPRRGRTGIVLVDFVPGNGINAVADAIRRYFQIDAYLDVHVTTAHGPASSPDALGQHLICNVATGPQYRVRQIHVTPALTSDTGKADWLPNDFPLHPEDYYSRQERVFAVRSLEQFVRRNGSLDAIVTSSFARIDQPGYLDVVFSIKSASQQSFAPPTTETGAVPAPWNLSQVFRGAGQLFRSGGQTRPSAYYLQDDIQYFPAPAEKAEGKAATQAVVEKPIASEGLKRRFTRHIQESRLEDVLREFSVDTGLPFLLHQAILNDKTEPLKTLVTEDFQDVTYEAGLKHLLEPLKLGYKDIGIGIVIQHRSIVTPLPGTLDVQTPSPDAKPRYSFEWHEKPLNEVVKEIGKAAGQTMILEEAGLAEVGLTPQHPVEMAVKDLTVEGVLKALATSTELAIRQEKDFLVLTSPDRATPLVVRTYPVADLIIPLPDAQRPAGPSAKDDPSYQAEVKLRADRLIDLLTAIHPESWDRSGGRGTMQFHEQTLSLVVRQTDAQHDAFTEVLHQLRRQHDFQVSFHVQRRGVTADEWKTLSPSEIDRFVTLTETPPEGAKISLTAFNAQRISFDSVGIASVDVMGVIAADRRSVSLSLFPAKSPSLFQPLVVSVEDGKTILVDISETLSPSDPDRKDAKRVVLQVTPKIIVQEEEEELLGIPKSTKE